MRVFLAKPYDLSVFFTPMDQNTIFQPWFWRQRIVHLISFWIWQYLPIIFMNCGSQESCERDTQASFEGLKVKAKTQDSLVLLSDRPLLPPSKTAWQCRIVSCWSKPEHEIAVSVLAESDAGLAQSNTLRPATMISLTIVPNS